MARTAALVLVALRADLGALRRVVRPDRLVLGAADDVPSWQASPARRGSGRSLSCFGLTVVSAILPWVNAEVIVVSFAALAHSPAEVALVVIVATSGQMLGKSVVFWTGRRGERWRGHESAWSSRWRERLDGASGGRPRRSCC